MALLDGQCVVFYVKTRGTVKFDVPCTFVCETFMLIINYFNIKEALIGVV